MNSTTSINRQESSKNVIKSATREACAQMFESLETRILFSTYTVTSVADSGIGSLRDAIVKSNTSVGTTDTIKFNIAGKNPIVSLSSALPDITDRVTIDGWSQKGKLVAIDGTNAGAGVNGLTLVAAKIEVRGLSIGNFDGAGIKITGNATFIRGSYVGLNLAGDAAAPNKVAGILVDHAVDTRIGAITPSGLDFNAVSGNLGDNVRLEGALRTRIIGNLIGAANVGNAVTSGADGIDSIGSTLSQIQNNFIYANKGNGITLNGSTADFVAGNFIGFFLGTSNIGDGIRVTNGSSDETIGGLTFDMENLIDLNGGSGINVVSGSRINLRANDFSGNQKLAIDLNGDGATANDAGDLDLGANNTQNFPVITQVTPFKTGVTAHVQLDGKPSQKYTIDFYNGYAPNATGRGDGSYMFTATVMTDATGHYEGDLTGVGPLPMFAARFVSCMATDVNGSSSEFSAPLEVANQLPAVKDDADVTLVNHPVTIDVAANDTDPDQDVLTPISSTVPSNGTVSIVNGKLTYTPSAGFIGTDTFVVTMSDGGGATALSNCTVAVVKDGAVTLIADPSDPTQTALAVFGTDKGDTIDIKSANGGAKVTLNGKSLGSFNFSGKIIANGLGGDDKITVDSAITRSAWLIGGDGNDTITAGSGDDLLLGGNGADHLYGKKGRDILIGGHGGDTMDGGDSEDMLIAGPTVYDEDLDSFTGIAKEWSRTDLPFSQRLSHIGDFLGGGLNYHNYINAANTSSGARPADFLTGGASSDAFFFNFDQSGKEHDHVTDLTNADTSIDIGLDLV